MPRGQARKAPDRRTQKAAMWTHWDAVGRAQRAEVGGLDGSMPQAWLTVVVGRDECSDGQSGDGEEWAIRPRPAGGLNPHFAAWWCWSPPD